MIDIDAFSEAVAEIYDASLSADRWDTVLATLARLFDSSKAQLSYIHSWSDRQPFFRFHGFDPVLLDRLMAQYLDLVVTDPRRTPLTFKPIHCRQVVSEDILRASEIYRQVLEPMCIEYSMFVVLDCDTDARCIVGLMRGADSPPFTAADCEDFGRFVPHLSRAIRIRDTLSRAHDIAAASQALIDGVPVAMIVLQDDRILLTNAAASTLLDQGDALRRGNNTLQAATPLAQARLTRAIAEARGSPGAVVALSMQAGESGQLRVVVRTLEPESAGILGGKAGAVALYLTDSRRPIETREEIVRRLFGLTAREAAVVCALAQGDDSRAIAARLDIGLETVKTHLKHVMQSVGVKRQAELVKAVVASPAWMGVPHQGQAAPVGKRAQGAVASKASRSPRARSRAPL
jgi:DNA-binding CsgD family transcriptional regulator